MIARIRGENARTQFMRIRQRAGIGPWPRLFHNLRGSRKTELAGEYPLHVASRWIGNSARVANDDYPTITEDHYVKAVRGTVESSAAQNPAQHTAEFPHKAS